MLVPQMLALSRRDGVFGLDLHCPTSKSERLWQLLLIGLVVLCLGRLTLLDIAGSLASGCMAFLALHMVVKIPTSLTKHQVPCMLAVICAINFFMDLQNLRRVLLGRPCRVPGHKKTVLPEICTFFDPTWA